MKKLLAILTVFVITFALSVPAMAVESPSAATYYTVTYYGVKGIVDGSTQKVKENNDITINANSDNDPFVRWDIAGKYEAVDGSLTDETMKLKVQSDLIIKAICESDAASNDPNGNGGYDAWLIDGIGTNPNGDDTGLWIGSHAYVTYDAVENQLHVKADPSKGSFDSWSIYKVTYSATGEPVYTLATLGEDYDIVVDGVVINPNDYTEEELEKMLENDELTIIPKGDVVIAGNYNGAKTDPKKANVPNKEGTGDNGEEDDNGGEEEKPDDSGTTTPTDSGTTTPTDSGTTTPSTTDNTTSPKTFDYTSYALLIAVLSLGGIAFTTKKVLQK